jgi:hypothetical protein
VAKQGSGTSSLVGWAPDYCPDGHQTHPGTEAEDPVVSVQCSFDKGLIRVHDSG